MLTSSRKVDECKPLVDGEVNVGSFSAALGKSRLAFYCLPDVGDQVYDVSVVIDSVVVGPLQVTDVNVTGAGILLESGATTFTVGRCRLTASKPC